MFLNLGPVRESSARRADAGGLPYSSEVYTVIGGDLTVIGDLTSDGHVEIKGTIKGTVNSRSVELLESGVIEGALIAESVIIHGCVVGPVRANTVTAATTARIVGSVFHNVLNIEPGASLEGRRPWRPHIDRHLDVD
ncbi:MAG TPA: polymer-forming cytoskeletal protein [Kiloniellales bacterium]|jgi:cytoskeletal protein CcmA (bactofilin family)